MSAFHGVSQTIDRPMPGRINVEKRVYTFKRAYLVENDPRWTDT